MRRDWRPIAAPDLPDGLVLFDGVCVFCSRWVQFAFARDREARFRFVPAQSAYGRVLVARFGIDPDDFETNAVIEGGQAVFTSDAALAVLAHLPGWRWTRFLRIVPKSLRDRLYDRIARNRYRLFGKRDACLMPTPELAGRMITDIPTDAA